MPKKTPVKQTQAERLLEVARKAKAGKNTFARNTGKAAIAQQARKATKFVY